MKSTAASYPEVVASMSGYLDWTAALSEAVVADQGDVLDEIQAFRRGTQAASTLKSDPQRGRGQILEAAVK